MGKRLAQLISASLSRPLWLAVTVALVWFGVLLAFLFVLDASNGPHDALQELLSWFFLLWLVVVALYFVARIYRYYWYGEISLRAALVTVAAFHVPALVALFWGPFVLDFIKSYAAEFIGFDFWVCTALFLATLGFVCALIVLRYRKPERMDATGTRLACAAGICAILLAIAAGLRTVVPGFEPVYASFGADLPASTLLLFDIHPYAYALPLLGAVLAGFGLLASGAMARRAAFDGQIALLAVSNLAIVVALNALSLPAYKMCGNILEQARETGITRLHAAANLGRTESVMRHLARGAPVDLRDKRGTTPLHHAVQEDRADTAQALLARGADAGAPDEAGRTPLHTAVGRASWRDATSLEVVQMLLERGAPVNAARDSGMTALHVAASYRRPEVAALLLARGADVNAVAKKGTPLDFAYEGKHQPMIELLRQHGAVRATEQQKEAKEHSVQARAAPSGSCGV